MSITENINNSCLGYLAVFIALTLMLLPSGIIAFIIYFSIRNRFIRQFYLNRITIFSCIITYFSSPFLLQNVDSSTFTSVLLFIIPLGTVCYYIIYADAHDKDPLKIKEQSLKIPLLSAIVAVTFLYFVFWYEHDVFRVISYITFFGTLVFAYVQYIALAIKKSSDSS